ncbi:GNAT family N-acetyltransferase [Bacillus pseudomycoides]|uniref:GNAT family N-acetyltransferase n=1 Tax=Bacillus pseudomycoides TaxID=64104 RepID=UPI000BEB7212|nr:GNAT family N-acetyltransferase [Bacillus pseudomycoides]PEB39357.1 GNAT family N-acetyltransferase [Bacillus pseudomycoides]PGD97758.1 GNAT family N-acetyltransferase [Bacillus pseudomycoides]PHG17076.1 GNAT family N-acetyltransferase [Bacillus pseudomycoides]
MKIRYTNEIPNHDDLFKLYDYDGWNDFLNLSKETLHQAMVQSWYVISAYNQDQLIGTGRIISDGLINAYLCGLIVHPKFRNQGIGSEIVRQLVNKSNEGNLHIQLFSEEKNAPYYEKLGFEVFTVGMKAKKPNL